MTNSADIQAKPVSPAAAVVPPAVFATLLGAFAIYGVGFAMTIHNAAHETRHSFTFPCR